MLSSFPHWHFFSLLALEDWTLIKEASSGLMKKKREKNEIILNTQKNCSSFLSPFSHLLPGTTIDLKMNWIEFFFLSFFCSFIPQYKAHFITIRQCEIIIKSKKNFQTTTLMWMNFLCSIVSLPLIICRKFRMRYFSNLCYEQEEKKTKRKEFFTSYSYFFFFIILKRNIKERKIKGNQVEEDLKFSREMSWILLGDTMFMRWVF